MRAVVNCLLVTGILPKAPTTPPDWGQEGLSCAAFDIRNTEGTTDESNLAPAIAPVVTRKGIQRMLHQSPTPQTSRQPPPTAPPGAMPPPTPVTPPSRTRTRKQRDQGIPESMFPTQETARLAQTALSQGEHQGPYPTTVQLIADLLHKPQELMKRQSGDSHLFRKVQDLEHLLVIMDRASKFLFAYSLPNKTAESVAKKLLELLLIFGIPLSLRSDPGTEFTAEVVQHLCKWLNVTIDCGPTDHSRTQRAVERLGGWIHETLLELCKSCPRRWDEYVQPALWLHRATPDPLLPSKATPFRLLFGRDCRTQIDATSPRPDDEGMDGLHNLIADKSKNLRQVHEVRKDL